MGCWRPRWLWDWENLASLSPIMDALRQRQVLFTWNSSRGHSFQCRALSRALCPEHNGTHYVADECGWNILNITQGWIISDRVFYVGLLCRRLGAIRAGEAAPHQDQPLAMVSPISYLTAVWALSPGKEHLTHPLSCPLNTWFTGLLLHMVPCPRPRLQKLWGVAVVSRSLENRGRATKGRRGLFILTLQLLELLIKQP